MVIKRFVDLLICVLICTTAAFAQSDSLFEIYQRRFLELEESLRKVEIENAMLKRHIRLYDSRNQAQDVTLDSLKSIVSLNSEDIKEIVEQFDVRMNKTNAFLHKKADASDLATKTQWGFLLLLLSLTISFLIYISLHKRIKVDKSSIDEVSKAQDALHAAHVKMQEESVKLDSKMIELFERQMASAPVSIAKTETDHSLALKVADEIVRIEMNLSRMDASVKGYKQLTKAVQRIKDNFNANGYEIVDMLGKPYNAGMKVVANFAPDEKLSFGTQIITGIIKPQINYNGQMIQAAQITVSQNI